LIGELTIYEACHYSIRMLFLYPQPIETKTNSQKVTSFEISEIRQKITGLMIMEQNFYSKVVHVMKILSLLGIMLYT